MTTYKRHPEIFEKGRKIAQEKAKENRYRFPIDTPLTSEFAELIGAFIGDGYTNILGRTGIVQFIGHSDLDLDYHSNVLMPIVKSLCKNANPYIRIVDNSMYTTYYSIEFHWLLTKRFRFPVGSKTYSVKIPKEILDSTKDVLNSCIRGIFDTDGGIYFDKRSKYAIPYMRIDLQMKSKVLIQQVQEILVSQGINSKMNNNQDRIQINGASNCQIFIEKVGFSNLRHTEKIRKASEGI